MNRALIFLYLLLPISTYAQVRNELIWKPTLNDDTEEEYQQNYKRVLKAGFKLDLESLSHDDVIVSFTDLTTLSRNIPGKSDGISFNYTDQSGVAKEIFADRNDIHVQLKNRLELYLDDILSRIRIRGSVEGYKKRNEKIFNLS